MGMVAFKYLVALVPMMAAAVEDVEMAQMITDMTSELDTKKDGALQLSEVMASLEDTDDEADTDDEEKQDTNEEEMQADEEDTDDEEKQDTNEEEMQALEANFNEHDTDSNGQLDKLEIPAFLQKMMGLDEQDESMYEGQEGGDGEKDEEGSLVEEGE